MLRTSDPMERIIEKSLIKANIDYLVDGEEGNKTGLDFYLPKYHVYIEVKRLHSDRIGHQMKRVSNIIVAQGLVAVELLSKLIEQGNFEPSSR